MAQPQQLFIDGRWTDAASGATHEVSNAYTDAVVTVQAAAGLEDVSMATRSAHNAFAGWAATPPAARQTLLSKTAELLRQRADRIAATIAEETSGTIGWGLLTVGLAAAIFEAAGGAAYEPTAETVASDIPGLRSMAVRRPLGVCVGVAPWNAPLILGSRAVAWPLAFGNTVILKASEQSPRVHGEIVRALADAGAPVGVVNLITNDPASAGNVVGALIEDAHVAHVNFTGSSRVGAIIATTAAPLFKRTLLELGGKAPFIVLDDADLDAAAGAANFGAFMNAGQICMSTERIVVDRRIESDFVARLVQRAQALTVGSPLESATMVGPVVNSAAGDHFRDLVHDAVGHGAVLATGGPGEGALHPPTVLTGVTPAMRIYGEESFGPVVTVVAADGLEDAVRIANDTEYGLSAAVFGRDVERALRVAERIDSGICHVNGATVHDEATAPFGGVKASGWGRFGAGQVAHEFTTTRWVTVSGQERHYPI